MLRQLLVFIVVFMCTVHAGTWLAFNDFGGESTGDFGGYPRGGSIRDLVHACRENPKASKDGYQEHEAMCRILLRMTRSV